MKFNEYQYEHLDVNVEKKKIIEVDTKLKNAKTYEEFYSAFKELDRIVCYEMTQQTLVDIRHTIDTRDDFYTKENDHLNEIMPIIQEYTVHANDTILESPFCNRLRKDVPETYFLSKELERKSFSPIIIEDLQKENKLTSEYQALIASAQIEFDGQMYTLASLEVKTNDKDRTVRKRAMKAYWRWYEEHCDKIGSIYDELVQVRTTIAKKLGFENYIQLGYIRMKRYDYNQKDVENYRKQILDDVVPLNTELYERQRKRLGYERLQAWDEKIEFETGNPKPHHSEKEMVQKALKMYEELSDETGEFFKFMVEHELLDLDSKPGKAAGGYCTFIPDYKSPFIFANFNQTQDDAEVLTHEAGHAFQVYSSQKIFPSDCLWPTYETCEIHSMSMEFFTYPWMKSFFEEDVDKYYFSHLSGAVKFLPYGICVDHFQHEVYAHPDMSHQERMQIWRKLEKMYLPHKNYDEIEILENGGWWMKQLHIFMDPFYYIDYTLAQVCALQFWARIQKKDEQAFENYKHICKIGGMYTFRRIVKEANLKCPFDKGCLTDTMNEVRKWFKNTKDPR